MQSHMIILINVENAFDKILIKHFSKLGIKGNLFYLIKSIYQKSVFSIIFIGELLNAFSLRTNQGCLL